VSESNLRKHSYLPQQVDFFNKNDLKVYKVG
jgi:hypothetical protein